MSNLNETVSAERVHIAFFGRRNAGKSSLVNAVTGQELSVVSDVLGTTTDPVKKAMELLPIGPVMIIDTPGFDDEGELGEKRVEKTREILAKTDVAVLVVDAKEGAGDAERQFLSVVTEKKLPCITVFNKTDIAVAPVLRENEIAVSAKEKIGINELKELIGSLAKMQKIRAELLVTS